MRKICLLVEVLVQRGVELARADARSCPNGFSITIRARVGRPARSRPSIRPSAASPTAAPTGRAASARRSPSSSRAARTAAARSSPSSADEATNESRSANVVPVRVVESSARTRSSASRTSSAKSPSGAWRPEPMMRKSSGISPACASRYRPGPAACARRGRRAAPNRTMTWGSMPEALQRNGAGPRQHAGARATAPHPFVGERLAVRERGAGVAQAREPALVHLARARTRRPRRTITRRPASSSPIADWYDADVGLEADEHGRRAAASRRTASRIAACRRARTSAWSDTGVRRRRGPPGRCARCARAPPRSRPSGRSSACASARQPRGALERLGGRPVRRGPVYGKKPGWASTTTSRQSSASMNGISAGRGA